MATREPPERAVRTEMELRVAFRDEPGKLSRILQTLKEAGGALRGHLIYRLEDETIGLFVCEKPADAALALEEQGIVPETETVVLVRTENRPGVLRNLVWALEAEGIEIGYSYATSTAPELQVVFRTDDNAKAEDVLRGYLILPCS